jgi:hypothetical protein
MRRILLTAEDFDKLVGGGVVEYDAEVQVMLQDIGYDTMEKIIADKKQSL